MMIGSTRRLRTKICTQHAEIFQEKSRIFVPQLLQLLLFLLQGIFHNVQLNAMFFDQIMQLLIEISSDFLEFSGKIAFKCFRLLPIRILLTLLFLQFVHPIGTLIFKLPHLRFSFL